MANNKWLMLTPPLTLILCLVTVPIDGANILAFMPAFTTSHLVIEMAVVKAMAERNHNVTVVSALPLKAEWLHPNMIHIQLETRSYDMNSVVSATSSAKGVKVFLQYINMLDDIARGLSHTMDDAKLQELMNNRGNHYDLMILGYIFGDFFFGLAEHFNCPLALIWPNIAMTPHLKLIGNPLEMSYTTLNIYNKVTDDIGFEFRLKNMIVVCMELWMLGRQFNFAKTIYDFSVLLFKYSKWELLPFSGIYRSNLSEEMIEAIRQRDRKRKRLTRRVQAAAFAEADPETTNDRKSGTANGTESATKSETPEKSSSKAQKNEDSGSTYEEYQDNEDKPKKEMKIIS